jgi:hypothetical protein
MGRKETYTPAMIAELTAEICTRIAQGEPLRQICREHHMPGWVTVYEWIKTDDDFAERFARARELGYDAIAEETLEIANTPIMGEELELEGQGADAKVTKVKRSDMLGHRKLQIETRLKLLAKWSPKKYGDKQQVEMSGQLATSTMSDADIKAELAALANAGIIAPDTGDDEDGIDDLL